MLRLLLSLILISLLSSTGGVTQAETFLIDRIMAVVDEEIITYRDAAVERTLSLFEKDEDGALQDLINRKLILREADKFKITDDKDDAAIIQGRFEAVRKYLAGGRFIDFLREYSLTESDVLKVLTDQVIAEKFINFRIKFFIVIPEDAVKVFYEGNKEDYAEQSYSEAHDQIKKRLFRMESDKRLKEYLNGLRKRAGIVIMP